MAAVYPAYPLFPIASIIAAAMVLLVLVTSLVRNSWNLGVTFLCCALFVENLTQGINAIIWSDNADIKLYAYCDIGVYALNRNVSGADDGGSLAPASNNFCRQTYGHIDHHSPTASDRKPSISRIRGQGCGMLGVVIGLPL